MTSQRELAAYFHTLHIAGSPLTLANVWDPASARIVAAAGARAIATTSAGLAWGLGAADGNHLDRELMLGQLARIVAAVTSESTALPVTADIESGFGATAAEVGETVARVLETGAVGVNIEDAQPASASSGEPLRPVAEQAERLAAAREAAERAGVPLYLNARIDVFLRQVGEESDRLAATLDRARAYLDAGASGVFVLGALDAETIAALAAGVDAPVNVTGKPGGPSVAELGKLGVARISMGAGIAEAAYALVDRAARELLGAGTYEAVRETMDYATINGLMKGEA
jgi:2-methylisocitrate lyase-like PEP mutase family enzyme